MVGRQRFRERNRNLHADWNEKYDIRTTQSDSPSSHGRWDGIVPKGFCPDVPAHKLVATHLATSLLPHITAKFSIAGVLNISWSFWSWLLSEARQLSNSRQTTALMRYDNLCSHKFLSLTQFWFQLKGSLYTNNSYKYSVEEREDSNLPRMFCNNYK